MRKRSSCLVNGMSLINGISTPITEELCSYPILRALAQDSVEHSTESEVVDYLVRVYRCHRGIVGVSKLLSTD